MTRFPRQSKLAAALCVAGFGLMAGGSALAEVTYRFSGFGTLGGAITNNDDTQFRLNTEQHKGADKRLDLGVDSRLAGQGTADFGHGISVTAQVLGARKGDNDFDVGFEWLYAQYTGIEGLDLKAGRVVLPAFLVSDSRLVGYATPWLRVSPLVYSMMPMSNVDGGQATYRHAIGPVIASVQVTSGTTKTDSSVISHVAGPLYATSLSDGKSSNILGFNAAVEWGDWTLRASQITDETTIKISIPSIAGDTVLKQLGFEDNFTGLGLQYDNGKVVVMAELVKRVTENDKINDAKAWYVAAGYRLGPVTPYAMVSQYKESFSTNGLPPKSTGLALGARYDLATNLALKAEWAQYKNNSSYTFTDSVSPDVADKKINVVSVALDFVF